MRAPVPSFFTAANFILVDASSFHFLTAEKNVHVFLATKFVSFAFTSRLALLCYTR